MLAKRGTRHAAAPDRRIPPPRLVLLFGCAPWIPHNNDRMRGDIGHRYGDGYHYRSRPQPGTLCADDAIGPRLISDDIGVDIDDDGRPSRSGATRQIGGGMQRGQHALPAGCRPDSGRILFDTAGIQSVLVPCWRSVAGWIVTGMGCDRAGL